MPGVHVAIRIGEHLTLSDLERSRSLKFVWASHP